MSEGMNAGAGQFTALGGACSQMWAQVLSLPLNSGKTVGKLLCRSASQKQLNCGEEIQTPSPHCMHAPQHHSLLHDFPSLPRLKPERQRQVRALWLLASRQMSEQPPGFPYWSSSQAWLLTADRWGAGQDLSETCTGLEKASRSLITLPPVVVFVPLIPSEDWKPQG